MARSYETALLAGIATDLAAQGFGTFYDPDSGQGYDGSENRPIYLEPSVVDADQAMWVLLRDTSLQPQNGQLTTVQIITREPRDSSRLDAYDFASQVAEYLTPRGIPRSQHTFGTVPTGQIVRLNLGDLGRDTNERPQVSQNYRVRGRRNTI